MVHNGIVYKLFANQATLFALDDRSLKDIVIPGDVMGRPVTEIADNAFANTPIRKIKLPNSIAVIGKGAFKNCDYLVGVYQYGGKQNQNIVIKDFAFFHCKRLETLQLNPYITLDGELIFYCCGLTSLGTSKIRSESDLWSCVFSKCERLKELSFIGKETLKIPDRAFTDCPSLKCLYFWCNVKITDYVKNKLQEITAYCNSTSNILDLAYEGYNIENMEVAK